MHAIAGIGLVDYYGRVFTANGPQWKPKEARKPDNSSRKRSAQTGTPHFTSVLQGPSTAPAGPILLKFWLKTRKSIPNKVTKFQIPTPNRLGARIEKTLGGKICPPPSPQGIGLSRTCWPTMFSAMNTEQRGFRPSRRSTDLAMLCCWLSNGSKSNETAGYLAV